MYQIINPSTGIVLSYEDNSLGNQISWAKLVMSEDKKNYMSKNKCNFSGSGPEVHNVKRRITFKAVFVKFYREI